jgi:tetratricopeptide (TPR) repeat protein
MTDDLYERYKETLRTGHVAVLRGSLDEAVDAYRAAAEIAPSRALPHTSLGGAYLRLGRLEDALAEFSAAVARAPHDEGALLGQAEALAAADMRSDAASALDHVAEIQEASGRLPEAADTLRRAIELEESIERTRRQRSLLREIRLAAGDQAAEKLLARALRLREEPGPEPAKRASAARSGRSGSRSAESGGAAEPKALPGPETVPGQEAPVDVEGAAETVSRGERAAGIEGAVEPGLEIEGQAAPEPGVKPEAAAEPEGAPEAAAAAAAEAPAPEPAPLAAEAESIEGVGENVELPAVVGVWQGTGGQGVLALAGAADGSDGSDGEHQPSGDELLAAAEAADQAGDNDALRSLLIWTARAYAQEGRFEAGLDAAHRLLLKRPADVDAHLVLVELYAARSWDNIAVEKLKLLDRLAELSGDQETHERLCALAGRVFPDDPGLARICS